MYCSLSAVRLLNPWIAVQNTKWIISTESSDTHAYFHNNPSQFRKNSMNRQNQLICQTVRFGFAVYKTELSTVHCLMSIWHNMSLLWMGVFHDVLYCVVVSHTNTSTQKHRVTSPNTSCVWIIYMHCCLCELLKILFALLLYYRDCTVASSRRNR